MSTERIASAALTDGAAAGPGTLMPYIRIARLDHWPKNVLMLPGIAVALFYQPERLTWRTVVALALTLAATCLVASSNYVLNELLDAATDRFHPHKAARPAVSGKIRTRWAVLEWALLAGAGVGLALAVSTPVAVMAAGLWLMGVLYNVPPIRLKDSPYLDVLSESANNPLRLGLGWFAVIPDRLPPFSLVLAYWMSGAFLMTVKRLSEYRELSAQRVAGPYRRSFQFYTEQKLLVSCIFYAVLGAEFGGMFMLRYRPELVLMAPLVAGVFAHYMQIAYKPRSAVQHPERLYLERRLSAYLVLCLILFVVLMFVHVPVLYEWFTVDPAGVASLWEINP
ncbi:MAG: prenyltransferase [Luteitalea sp.]|nr:prenyltransferase [Luteitalea sp.]